jgi:hypothetical protein
MVVPNHTISGASNLDYSNERAVQPDLELRGARIAVYEDVSYAPMVIDVPYTDDREMIGALAATTHTQVTRIGGSFPYRIILEACENLIHAHFVGIVISISNKGRTLVFSDQGPGIAQPAYALNTGFTSATPAMKAQIRGVGAGFTIIREYLDSVRGSMHLDSNIERGTVLTLHAYPQSTAPSSSSPSPVMVPSKPAVPHYTLNERQKGVLSVLLKYEFVGPQLVAQTLDMGLATAHRDLKTLEECGLVERTGNRKSTLTQAGFEYVDYLSKQ